MNVVILMGRLTKDPEVRYTADGKPVGKYTLAVERRYRKDEQTADFLNCTVFNKGAEFAEKYFQKGTRVVVRGRIQTGSYKNKEGQKIYTTDIIVEEQEFAESKKTTEEKDDFMSIPDNYEGLPFN